MIRKVVFILLLLLNFSCSNSTQKAENTVATEEATESELANDRHITSQTYVDAKKIKTTYTSLLQSMHSEIEEKLQASYEASVLITKHPEFKDAIVEQLAHSNKFATLLSDSIQSIKIKDIQYIDNLEVINDSIAVQKIRYAMIVNSVHSLKDSANLVMKQTIVEVENRKKVQTSFTFQIIKE
ncbi:hypothetical protein [Kordia zhangzhouensis]|uniref:hypothetical protein n=1 Tax=Kordia zhangzhouensis TaxID=1620405 RepID=UPI0006290557|nr:hypothetical protein [Kordia zhangzhouensis]